MKLIIAGTRTATEAQVRKALDRFQIDTLGVAEVVSGGNKNWDWRSQSMIGADYWGEAWAKSKGIGVTRFPAQWDRYGRSAGPRRNRVMAEYADALLAIWDGKSRGTQSMIEEALNLGLTAFVYRTDLDSAHVDERQPFKVGQ